jgi:hypothetical protein
VRRARYAQGGAATLFDSSSCLCTYYKWARFTKPKNAFAQSFARGDAVFPSECERLMATFVVKPCSAVAEACYIAVL